MKIKENIYGVGVVDEKIRVFHGYETPIGTTYNAYLIVDEKITLIDFVKAPFKEELLTNIKNIIGDEKIDYIICNHAEPDHSGAMPYILDNYKDATVYATMSCLKELGAYYPDQTFNSKIVKLGDSINTGKYTFEFIPIPMIHWPDSMATYLKEEKVLFPNDALGQHIGSGERFASELSKEKLIDRAGDYYANIVLPFGMQVNKLLDTISKLDIQLVCSSHGVILDKYLSDMINKYYDWANNKVDEKKLVIIYDTMWQTTRKMAEKKAKEYEGRGFDVEIICLSEYHYSYALARLLEAKYIFVGSPTLNNNMLPSVIAFLTYMKGLKPKNRIGLAFGSYGWSGEAAAKINDVLIEAGFETLDPERVMWNI